MPDQDVVLWRASRRCHHTQLRGVAKLPRQMTSITVHGSHTYPSLAGLGNTSLCLIGSMTNSQVFGVVQPGCPEHITPRIDNRAYIAHRSVATRGYNEAGRRSNAFSENQVGSYAAAVQTYSDVERRVKSADVALYDRDIADARARDPLRGSAH